MKRTFLSVFSVATVMLVLSSCGGKETANAGDAQNVAVADTTATAYSVNQETVLEWAATKKVGSGHNGTISVSAGELNFKGADLVAGKFDIDMKSIVAIDITDPKKNGDFIGHMMSDDFFSIEKFPTSTFEITEVKAGDAGMVNVSGNLTIKGISKNITIPAKITKDDKGAQVDATFSIDRTEWDIRYGSGKFFTDLGDKVINDAIDFKLALKATKK
ncbi:MAG: YceI family protein [Flavobacteriales bacterium]|nr:YceI family protein [Flavobacteriales bacterium]